MATDTHRLIYKHREKESYRKMQKGKKIPHVSKNRLRLRLWVNEWGQQYFHTHTQKRMFRATGRKEKREEEVILSSHTETYRNKNKHMKPLIKRTMQRQRGFR